MNKLIALDDGHGMETMGKRTPNFPDGSYMHENEFNRAVVSKLNIHLKRCGFNTILTAPTDADTPLGTRTKTAITAKANLFLSIHANANTGVWGKWGGISSHIFAKGGESERIANVLHKSVLQGTKLRDRGIEVSNFQVLRDTHNAGIPAILFELAFMDNMDEAKLLLSDAYRSECAEEIAKGVCEYYGVKWIPEPTPMTYCEALKICCQHVGFDEKYWINKANIDPCFDDLIIRFAKFLNTKG